MRLSIGLCLPNFGRHLSINSVITAAEEAENLGYDSLWTTDHIAIGRTYSYPYGTILESITTLSYRKKSLRKLMNLFMR